MSKAKATEGRPKSPPTRQIVLMLEEHQVKAIRRRAVDKFTTPSRMMQEEVEKLLELWKNENQ